ncbi:MAG TPA: hypothetical protein VH500_16595 [Nitrososphaeraceae archaeon]
MALLRRLLRVRTTNDKILQVYLRENNDVDDGIYYLEADRNSPSPVPIETEIPAVNIIKKSDIFPGESVNNIVIDTNHVDHPSDYIISLCFSTFDGTNSKLYMGRISGAGMDSVIWTQCADSPRVHNDTEILSIFSSFLNTDPVTPVKILNIKTPDGSGSVIWEHH